MGPDTEASVTPRIYTTEDGRTVIEQSKDSVVVLSADQILTVIDELRTCYDYCASWKETSR